MESRQALILSAAVVAILCLCQVPPVHSQSLPLCRNLRNDFADDQVRLFRNADGAQFIIDHLCVNNRNRVRRFYSCPKGFTAFIPSRDNATTLRDFRTVLDIRSISRQLQLRASDVLICTPPRLTPAPPTPLTVETDAPIPALPSCPSGATRVNEYVRQDQDKLCQFTCSFRTAVFGIPTGERTRTIFRCCNGEPQLISRALGLYKCPAGGN